LLHHNLIEQLQRNTAMRAGIAPEDLSVAERLELLRDPVVDALVEKLARAKDVALYTLAPVFHPRVKESLLGVLRRGGWVTIYTNSRNAYLTIAPVAFPWPAGLPDLEMLVNAGAKAYFFQARPELPWVYLHRKVAVVDDTVFFGSHNFNLPSTVTNDEISYELESSEFATQMRKLYVDSILDNGTRLDALWVQRERRKTEFFRWLTTPLVGFF
jgi:phosphatidylserine/phosphatidylglycerophosphate/cardiolipin synthase-like enzyme